ncbi:MAG: flagellar biosynthesis protein FlhB [Deltaproteobacteria bacterium]|nr:flagellar biosynthesis protein FlhB [Deltaproteobacteria bacterium]
MASEDDQEKTEQPTAKKLEKAREEGQVAQSQEIPTVVVLGVSLLVFVYAGFWMWQRAIALTQDIFRRGLLLEIEPQSLMSVLSPYALDMALMVSPLILAIAIAGSASYVGQFGFLVSTKAITPDISKINPVSGFKRLFSLKAIFDAVKGSAKIIIIGAIAWSFVQDRIPALLMLSGMEPGQIMSVFWQLAQALTMRVVGALLILAIIDYLYQKYDFTERQKMTKQEIKDEFKNTEGDPKVKSRIRRIQMEMAHKRMMQEVPKADVVITNPTHFSVAIRYDKETGDAPVVVAKGADLVAFKIREIAGDNGVPILERKELARELYKVCKLGQAVPMRLYQAVAEVLAYVYRLNDRKGKTA